MVSDLQAAPLWRRREMRSPGVERWLVMQLHRAAGSSEKELHP